MTEAELWDMSEKRQEQEKKDALAKHFKIPLMDSIPEGCTLGIISSKPSYKSQKIETEYSIEFVASSGKTCRSFLHNDRFDKENLAEALEVLSQARLKHPDNEYRLVKVTATITTEILEY